MIKDPLHFFQNHQIDPRAEQVDVLNTVKANWNKYKYFCISAPPGVGKTYIATAIADAAASAYVLTSTHMLQEQYEESWSELVNLKGRGNYTCALNSNFTVDAAPCNIKKELVKSCKTNCTCPYYNRRKEAMESKSMITNPPFMLYSTHCGFAKEGSSEWNKREVLLIDEAHHLESHLVSFAESDIDIERLEKLYGLDLSDVKFYDGNNTHNYQAALTLKNKLQAKYDGYQGVINREYSKTKVSSADLGQWAQSFTAMHGEIVADVTKKSNAIDKVLQPLNMFFGSSQADVDKNWILSKTFGKNALKISPLYASFLFEKHLGKLADKFVFMSATLGTKSAFCKELGIPESDCLYIDCDSPFPAELSPIVIMPLIKLSKDVYDVNIKKLGPIIDTILDEHKGQRGIIHAVTYDIQKQIFDRVRSSNQRRLTCRDMVPYRPGHKQPNNGQLLEAHMAKSDSILVSPSMMTGVDLKDDLSAFQIIVKMPWGNLGDARIKRKQTIDSDWYANNCWRNLIQACGRSTRHDKDTSVTYVLDANFNFFYSKWERNLPGHFIKRLTS